VRSRGAERPAPSRPVRRGVAGGSGAAHTPLTRWLASFGAAFTGVWLAWRGGRNLRVQVACGYVVLLLASWLGLPGAAWAALVLAAGLVLAAEAANSALEAVVDLVHPRFGDRAGEAKDLAAGAVLLAAAAAAATGVVVFAPFLPALGPVIGLHLRAAPLASAVELAILLLLVGAAVRGAR
jgi:diacylglycerol kinase